MELKGKIAVLTGAKRIGVEVAETLALEGVNLVLSYLHSKKIAEKTAASLNKKNIKAYVFRADLTREKDVKKLFKFALQKFGRIDFLIAMASTFRKIPFKKLNEKNWTKEIDNNLKTAFLCAKGVAEIMVQRNRGAGKIILFGDANIDHPYKEHLPYLAAKAGVHSLAKILAKELAPKILVNCIAPGAILPFRGISKKEYNAIAKRTLLGRWGVSRDIASAVLFLLKNDFITGQIVYIDGGRSLF